MEGVPGNAGLSFFFLRQTSDFRRPTSPKELHASSQYPGFLSDTSAIRQQMPILTLKMRMLIKRRQM